MPSTLDTRADAPIDLSLPEAIEAITEHKKYPIVGAAIGLVASIILVLTLRPLYEGQVIIAFEGKNGGQLSEIARSFGGIAAVAGINLPTGGDGERGSAIATLGSYQALASFIDDRKITEDIFRETTWGPWRLVARDQTISTWEAVRRLRKHISVEELKPSGMIRVKVQWYDPKTAAAWANDFARHVDSILRTAALDRSKQRLAFLQREFERISALAVRDAMSKVIENELRTLAFASADREFAFRVIDPAIRAERPVRPRRALLVAMLTSLGALTGIVLALAAAVRNRR